MKDLTATANRMILNSTQIPNVILDEWMPKLPKNEFYVVLAIARQTYGWQKETDQISYSQLKRKTGYESEAISSAVKSLRKKGIIEVTDGQSNVLKTREECRGKDLHYRLIITSSKIEELGSNLFENRSSKIEDTKETNTKISIINNTNGDKSPKSYGNENVNRILKEFSELTGLQSPADRYPRRVAQNFIVKYGVENFRPALEYFQSIWKKVEITKIETVKLHYPTYLRDVKKVSVDVKRQLTKEEQAMADLYAERRLG